MLDILESKGIDRRGKFEIGVGGTAYNLACNYKSLGSQASFISALEKDGLFTRLILLKLKETAGKRWISLVEDIGESGFVGIREHGDLTQAVNSTPIEKLVLKPCHYRDALASASFLHLDLNNSIETIREFLKVGLPAYLSCVSESKALKLLDLAGDNRINGITLNRHEASALLKAANRSRFHELSSLIDCLWIVTLGEFGAALVKKGKIKSLHAPMIKNIVSYSGCGDAFAAAFIHAKEVLKLSYEECAKAGFDLASKVAVKHASNAFDGNRLQNTDRMIFVDALTGLYTRRYFEEEKEGLERHEKMSVVLVDIDNFKKVNDTHGHDAGDQVLRKVGEVVRRNVRKNDLAVRFGGEEILVIFQDLTGKDAWTAAERIRTDIEAEAIETGAGKTLQVTISGGLAEVKGDCLDNAIKIADERLYTAKKSGKNRIYPAA
ncbi:MAG: hypothetical protein A2X93_04685 [Deltaproteobacteria bacterium GWC2_56_8]|nr:MAG: hypothetical protein A2X93_04685 [Deltaproteobacteria bacterium GWC2_56_8]